MRLRLMIEHFVCQECVDYAVGAVTAVIDEEFENLTDEEKTMVKMILVMYLQGDESV